MTASNKQETAKLWNATAARSQPVEAFRTAQRRVLSRYGIAAKSRFVDVPAIGGTAHVLVVGAGPPLVMVIGGSIPAALWAPLMPQLQGYTLYAMDLPGFGLTEAVSYQTATMRSTVVGFLAQVLDGIGVERSRFVTHSQGSLWTTWLSLDQPERVAAQVHIGSTAHILGTSPPLPMRVMSIPPVGRLLLKLQSPSLRQVERVFAMVHEDVSEIPEIRDVLLACERLPAYGGSMLALMNAVMRVGRVRPEIALVGEQLALVSHPVQLIWGDRDPFGSVSVARRAAAFLPDAELHVVSGGHAPWFNRPEEVGALARRFLADHRDKV
ncbi:MAG TPA: alpha/beta hydrolase [Actinomycetes bacterium]|jgi:pimeloyl-ACP methyl ester carboxylesterase|nr:alpha/beta hydrolase [Actinomycetes bacterium]